jgi:hypothetical protein
MVVCEVRSDKDNPNHTQITIGGNCICYPGNVGTNTASLELLKLLLNSVLLQKGACFSSIDLKSFYLDTPMPEPEYVCINISDILNEIIHKYKLTGLDRDGWIYFEIRQGCYGSMVSNTTWQAINLLAWTLNGTTLPTAAPSVWQAIYLRCFLNSSIHTPQTMAIISPYCLWCQVAHHT